MIELVIIGILICAAVSITVFLSKNDSCDCDFDTGVIMGGIIVILAAFEIYLFINTMKPTPSALDVYRGKTELEITSVNGTPIDTVVVFKKN